MAKYINPYTDFLKNLENMERNLEIAKEMKKEGFDKQMIMKLTGLSAIEIENL